MRKSRPWSVVRRAWRRPSGGAGRRGLSSSVGYGASSSRTADAAAQAEFRVDLRSDTVTKPTAAMHAAMRALEVHPDRLGDDVFGEDPTVHALERYAADLFGKDSALFVPSGTMGNLLAILAHTKGEFGAEYIVGDQQHTYLYEQGNTASVARCHTRVVPNKADGTLCLDAVRAAVQPDDPHYGATKLVSCENTHNMCGGMPLPISFMDDMGALCKERGLIFHVDGARVMNACAALGELPSRVCRDVDSISVCLSKGLAAPVGSVVVGEQDFIGRCRRYRKALGGGMRQAGVLAACGLVALRDERLRLHEDHATLCALVQGLAGIHPAIHANVEKCHTNIAFFGVDGGRAGMLCARLEAEFGVRMGAKTDDVVRAVTHREVGEKEVEMALDAVRKVTAEW